MIKATFKINDIDLSNIILYDVTPTPIINSQIQTLDGVIHRDIVGWKDYINVQVGDTKGGDLTALFAVLSDTVTVNYYSEKLGYNRTADFIVDTLNPLSISFWNESIKNFGSFGFNLIEKGVYNFG